MQLARGARVANSGMLARLSRETAHYHQVADNARLAILGAADPARYAGFLIRIYGFEAPLEAALLMTPGLDEWFDLRGRGHLRLLRADLQSLGVGDPNQLPRCSTISPFRHPAEALGWVYVAQRNTLLHGIIERQLRGPLSELLKIAGSYLAGQQRSNGLRLRDLGAAMDGVATSLASSDRIVAGAKAAFRAQHGWFDLAVPSRLRVA
jgi:heme oxygenase